MLNFWRFWWIWVLLISSYVVLFRSVIYERESSNQQISSKLSSEFFEVSGSLLSYVSLGILWVVDWQGVDVNDLWVKRFIQYGRVFTCGRRCMCVNRTTAIDWNIKFYVVSGRLMANMINGKPSFFQWTLVEWKFNFNRDP